MTCSKCTQIPIIDYKNCTVYLTVNVDHLYDKVDAVLAVEQYSYVKNLNFYELNVDDFQKFIVCLLLRGNFSSLESHEVLILPVDKGQTLNFGIMSAMRSLNKWENLLKSKDFMYILKQQSFINYFQPILNLKTNKIYGYEALIRGVKKDLSIMPPMEMFELAKENDLLFNLDRQARESAINNSAKLGISDKVFINFIPTSIYDPENCLKSTSALIKTLNLKPEQIVFEVVETEKIDDYNHLKNILDYYRNKGFSIALDDVGSGYNSIDTIKELYPDYIKVDIGIIKDINLHSYKQKVFNDLFECCQKNNVMLLAEGVETKEEFDYISNNGAQLAQGYYIGRPSTEI